MSSLIRLFKPSDREAVRHICCENGYLGKSVDPLFQDRELFADYLTKYYTDLEPESTVVLEKDGKITGYVMGCRFPKKQKQFDKILYPSLFLRGIWRYIFKYNAASKKFVRWILTQGRKQVPHTPQNMPHFH